MKLSSLTIHPSAPELKKAKRFFGLNFSEPL